MGPVIKKYCNKQTNEQKTLKNIKEILKVKNNNNKHFLNFTV